MNIEEKIFEMLGQMQKQMIQMDSRLSNLEEGQKQLDAKVDNLQEDMTEVKDNIRYLWEDYNIQEKRIDKLAK